jgi:hypothetical protein
MLIVPRRRVAASSYDTDAQAYITAVETADGQPLETATRDAINAFVVGCKTDATWSAIKASCILAGARTMAGALTPLVGPAPTNIGFASGDYNRKTGLLGNATSRSLNSNRNNNADPQNSSHNAVWVTTAATGTAVYIGVGPGTNENGSNNIGASGIIFCRNRSAANGGGGSSTNTGFIGTSRSSSAAFSFRLNSATSQVNITSQTPYDGNVFVFSSSNSAFRANGRMSFYSIGEALDLALLEARTATLMASLSAAIP